MEADNERLDKRRFLLETAFSDSVLIFGVYILIEGSYQDRMLAMCRGYLGNLRLMSRRICLWVSRNKGPRPYTLQQTLKEMILILAVEFG